MAGVRKVRCPQCGGEALWAPENKWRPFCSERCKQIDLGAWASESYRIVVQVSDEEAGAPGLDFPDASPRN
ncbi:DNA gyrase inhibitor YacG [Dechloromonas sp.]|uniref:DNA gyrase inhibitor YacG n=1 Tax=Dechloromonas sp. TaxID=1917218 RepID=UPI00120F3985|nr:DNA gyrase inhibitor YacG [Dechloromonas sp.]MBU3696060.1 DNA gyrase inhibitor YacG [Dechloromonas sp.]TEX47518.1 MAG: DNA gyrase inhibitor YacG [Rhodocyclaceae bacterium]